MIPVFQPEFGEEEKKLLCDVVQSGRLTEGPKTAEFESLLKDFLKVDHVVAVPSGGIALYLAFLAVGIKLGSIVLMPDYCHISLPNAVKMIGASPKFVDVNTFDGNIRCPEYTNNVTYKTRCLSVVNMNGRYCDMRFIKESTDKLFPIIEDSCQSFPSTLEGKHLFSDAGCLSFHPTKIISCGNGGAVFTNNGEIFREVKRFKDYGRFIERKTLEELPDLYDSLGTNLRFTEMQAAIGIAQLHRLPERIKKMREVRQQYQAGLKVQLVNNNSPEYINWVIDVQLKDKIGLNIKMKAELAKRGIETRLPYIPMHHQPLYDTGQEFIGSDVWSQSCLWLPSSPSFNNGQIDYVIKNTNEVYEKLKSE